MTSTLDQTTARVAHWPVAPPVAPRGVVVVVPGRGEHPGVYERFGRRISADGYIVYAVGDPSIDDVLPDIRAAIDADQVSGPRVLVGSDSGASYVAGLAAQGTVRADALVLSGLVVGLDAAADLSWDDELAARTSCSAHRGRLDADAGFRRGSLSAGLPRGWAQGLAEVAVPVLGLHGDADPVSPLKQVRPVYAAAQRAELVSIAGGRHDALNDQTHRTAAATVVLFLERLRLDAEASPIANLEALH